MPDKQQVFISYSRKDKDFALQLTQSIMNLGLDVWLDLEDIRPGSEWSDSIQEGLDSSAIMLLIISPDSMSSKNVGNEWKYFLDQRKPLIPLQLRPARVHFQLGRIQYIDFHGQAYDKALGQLQAELRFKQGLDVPAQPTEIPPPTQPQLQIDEQTTNNRQNYRASPSNRQSSAGNLNLWLIILVAVLGTMVVIIGGQSVIATANPESDNFNPIIAIILTIFPLFMMLSILVSQILSLIQQALNLRPRQLVAGISELIPDPKIRIMLLTHPLIQLLKAPFPLREYRHLLLNDPATLPKLKIGNIAYIPADIFATALFDVLSLNVTQDLYAPLYAIAQDMPDNPQQTQVQATIRSLQGSQVTFKMAHEIFEHLTDPAIKARLLKQLQNIEADYAAGEIGILLNGIHNMDDPELKHDLEMTLFGVRSLEDARSRLEKWFLEAMSRVATNFRRKLLYVSALVGFLLALLFNIDTLHIINTIPQNGLARDAINQALTIWEDQLKAVAVSISDEPSSSILLPEPASLEQFTSSLNLVGWEYTSEGFDIQQQLGLDPYRNSHNLWNFFPGNNPGWLSIWFQKILGLIITTIVIAQGAPFVYGVMKTVMRRIRT